MTTITAPPELIQRLGRLDEKFEFRDAQGRLAGPAFQFPPGRNTSIQLTAFPLRKTKSGKWRKCRLRN